MKLIRPQSSKNAPVYKRAVSLGAALVLFAALAASFVAVRTRAAGFGIPLPASFSKLFASRTASLAPTATTLSPAPPVGNQCTSLASGNWNDNTKWATCGGTFPGPADDVFIETTHTITLTGNESCNDLNLNNTSAARLALGANTLSVNGKLRAFTGAAPGTSGLPSGTAAWIASTTGKISIVGNSRTLTTVGEWDGGNSGTASPNGFDLEVNLNAGQIATVNTSLKARKFNILAGTLQVSGAGRLAPDQGAATNSDFTIASGASVVSDASGTVGSAVIGRTSGAGGIGGILTVNSGGSLVLTGSVPRVEMNVVNFNGTVEYAASATQTLLRTSSGANPSPYNNLKLSGTSLKTLGLTTTVNGTLTMAGTASLSLSTFTLIYGSSSTLEYAGSGGAQTTTDNEFPNANGPNSLTINNGNGVSLHAGKAINGTLTLTLTSGALSNGSNLTLGNGASVSRSGGSLSGTPSFGTSVNVSYSGSGGINTGTELPASSSVLNNLTANMSSGAVVSLQSPITVNGTFTLTSGTVNGAEFNANSNAVTFKGNFSNTNGVYSGGTSPTTFGGATILTANTANNQFGSVTISSGATLDASLATIRVAGDWLDNSTSGGASGHSGSITQFDAGGAVTQTIGGTVASPKFNRLEVLATSGAIVKANKGLDIDGIFNLGSGTFDDGGFSHTIHRHWWKTAGTTYTATGTLTFDGQFGSDIQASNFNNIAFNKDSAATAIALQGAITVAGNWTNTSGTISPGGQTVTFNGSGNTQAISGNNSLFNLTISHGGAGSVTTTNTLTVTGLLNVAAGTFTSATQYHDVLIDNGGTLALSGPISVDGNWQMNTGGTFTPGTNGVTFNGPTNQTITGNTSFYNLTKTITTPAQTFKFAAGSLTTVTNLLTLTGTSGNLLSLRSATDGSPWNLKSQGTESVSFVDVKDSNASTGNTIQAPNSTNSGSNTNWNFPFSVSGTLSASSSVANKTIKLFVNGANPQTTLTDSGGLYTFSVSYTSGDIITVFVSGDAINGATVTRGQTGGGNISGLNISQNTLIVRHEDAGPITNANLNSGQPTSDADLNEVYSVAGGNQLSTVDGISLLINSGSTFAPGNAVFAGGNWINNGTFTAGSNTVTFNGTGAQTIGGSTTTTFSNLSYQNTTTAFTSSATFNVGGALTIGASTSFSPSGGTITMNNGASIVNNGTLTFNALAIAASATVSTSSSFAVNSSLVVNSGGIFTPGGGTITMNNGSSFTGPSGLGQLRFSGLTIANGATVTNSTVFEVGGVLTVGTGATFSPTGTTIMRGGSSIVNNGALTLKIMHAQGGAVTTSSSFTISNELRGISGASFTASAGTITFSGSSDIVNGGTISFNDLSITGSMTSADSFSVAGSMQSPGSFAASGSGGTVTFNGSGNLQTISGTNSFKNLTIDHSGAGNVSAIDTLSSSGLLRVLNGTFTSATSYVDVTIESTGTLALSGPITVSGTWTNNGGTFTPGTNAVTFNGTNQAINGSTSFYDFFKQVAAADTMTFDDGATQTVTHELKLTGAAGQLLSLRSSTTGNQWKLVAPTLQTVAYVDVKDSDATGTNPITPTNSTNSGNNINWVFGNTISGTVIGNHGNGSPLTSKKVTLVNGAFTIGSTTTDVLTGDYSFSNVTLANNDRIGVFIDDETENGFTATLSGTSSITGLDVYQDVLIVRSDNGSSISNLDISFATNSDSDANAVVSFPSGVPNTSAGTDLRIWNASTTYGPLGNVVVGGNWINNGTFNAGANSVTFNGTANQTIGGNNATTFATLNISSQGTSPNNVVSLGVGSLATPTTVSTALNINAGSVFNQGPSASDDFHLTTNTVTVASGATWRNLGQGDVKLSGDVANAGTINLDSNGTGCGANDIKITSTGTRRTWSGSGTFLLVDVDVAGQKTAAPLPPVVILVRSGTDSDSGANTGFIFDASCPSGTYTWIGGTPGVATDWTVGTNWSPTRSPNAADELIFDGGVTSGPTVTNVPTETISKLTLQNGVFPVTLSATASRTLTITSALAIPATTRLVLGGTSDIQISLDGSATAAIGGELAFNGAAHRLLGNSTDAINFSGASSRFTTNTGAAGNPFGNASINDDTVRFQDGSQATFNAGGDPFGGDSRHVARFTLGSSQTFNIASAFSCSGSVAVFTARSYGTLILDGSVPYTCSNQNTLTVQSNFTLKNGSSLTLSGTSGGDLNLFGNFTDENTSGSTTFNANGRTVLFQGGSPTGATQTVSKPSGATLTFGNVQVSKPDGLVRLGGTLTISGDLQLTAATDTLELFSNTLNLNGTISGLGGLKGGSIGSSLNIGGTGALGTLRFVSGSESVTSMTVNRMTSGSVNLDSNLTIGDASLGGLNLTNGIVNTGNNTITLETNPIANHVNGYVNGNLQKNFGSPGTGNFTFPVGTANAYSPVDANVTANTSGTLTVKAVQSQLPVITGSNALQRYWTLSGSGLTAALTFNYPATDAIGTPANYKFVKKTGSTVTLLDPDAPPTTTSATISGISSFSDWTLAEPAAVFPDLAITKTESADPVTEGSNLTYTITVTNNGADATGVTVSDTLPAELTYVSATPSQGSCTGNPAISCSLGAITNGNNATITLVVTPTHAAAVAGTVDNTASVSSDQTDANNADNSATETTAITMLCASTFTVDSTGDGGDVSLGDAVCDDGTGKCTLRAAIQEGNALVDCGGSLAIEFAIPVGDAGHVYYVDNAGPGVGGAPATTSSTDDIIGGIDPHYAHSWWRISPATPLPALTRQYDINGYTQAVTPGTSASQNTLALNLGIDAVLRIELNGSLISGPSPGLDLETFADQSTIKGLVINNFGQTGIYIQDDGGDTISGNFIGTDVSGTLSQGSTGYGIIVASGEFDLIGGDVPEARNLISGHTAGYGIEIPVSETTVEGNYIGTDRTGSLALPNNNGVHIQSLGSNNVIGCSELDGDNVISGNSNNGVFIENSSDNSVTGNFIGTKANGVEALPNGNGILVLNASSITIGGDGLGNVISGNTGYGLQIKQQLSGTADLNIVQGNFIGTDLAGTVLLGNGSAGIYINAATNTVVGLDSDDDGAANTIANNTGAGVEVVSASAVGNAIRGNSIHDNGTLGIDLDGDGVTGNDSADTDPGPNNLQNFPLIDPATEFDTTVTGTLDSYSGGSFTIDVYSNTTCDTPNGNGEGAEWLGSDSVSGTTFSVNVPALATGQVLTATATDGDGNTSEFSLCVTVVTSNTPPTITAVAASQQAGSPLATGVHIADVNDTESGPGGVTVEISSDGGTTYGPSATLNGVTVSSIVNTNGTVTADVVADCGATNANFTLKATDGNGATATDTLTVTVTANADPTLSYGASYTLTEGNSITIAPVTGPSDNGTISTIVKYSQGTYTGGAITVDNSTGVVTLNEAATSGTITIRATDNCGAFTDASFSVTVNPAVCTPAPSPMVAWYPGDGNPNDIVGAHNGTLFGDTTFAAGKVNQAFSFDGNGDYVDIGDVDLSGTFTIDAWVYLNGSLPFTSERMIVSKDDTGQRSYLFSVNTDGTLRGLVVSNAGTGFTQYYSTTPLTTGTWQHVAMTYEGSGGIGAKIKFYVNGALQGYTLPFGQDDGGTPDNGSGAARIGVYSDVINSPFDGKIDEVEFIGSVLSEPNVALIYNASFAGKCRTCTPAPANMVSWWSAEDNANDIYGTNNGTFTANTYAVGKVGKAFSFTTPTDEVAVSVVPGSSLDITGNQLTVDGWIKPATNASAYLFGRSAPSNHPWIVLQNSAGEIRLITTTSDAYKEYPTGYTPPLNAWTHIAFVYDGTNMRLYANGVQVFADVQTGNLISSSLPFKIGNRDPGPDPPSASFSGLIDEVEVFNSALTQSDIARIANAQYGGKCHTSTFQFSTDTPSVTESAGNATITVTRTGAHDTAATVNYSATDGTATGGSSCGSGADYSTTLVPASLAFAAGEPSKTFNVPICDDSTYEGDETVLLALTGVTGDGASVGSPNTATLTISDDADKPSFAIDNVEHFEGNAGTTAYLFTVTKSGTTTLPSSVKFETQDGTATVADGDYTANSGTLSFTSSETQQQFTVLVNGDNKYEITEAFTVKLSVPTGATISNDEGTGTVTNDDAKPSFALEDVTHNEGDSGTTSYVFTVTKSGATQLDSAVQFQTVNGTATVADGDYQGQTGTLDFLPGETTKQVTILVNSDDKYETNEAFTLNLHDPVEATISDANGTGTINNDDAKPSFAIDDVTLAEGNLPAGTSAFVFTVTKTGNTALSSSVEFNTVDGTAQDDNPATEDNDYQAQTDTLTFGPTVTTQQITVLVNKDNKFEPNQAFTVNLHDAVEATISDANGTGTITNDDSKPTILINDPSQDEGTGGTTSDHVFTVTLSNPTDEQVTVEFATADGATNPATGGASCGTNVDYESKSGTVTFVPEDVSETITIKVCHDNVYELPEQFVVNLTSPVNTLGTGNDGQGVGTITNDDPLPSISIDDVTLPEGSDPDTTGFQFTVSLSNPSYQTITVDYSTVDGTAVAPADYVAIPALPVSQLTFNPGETSQTLIVTVNGDSLYELAETFSVKLATPVNSSIGDDTGVGTIDNDDPQPSFSINDRNNFEGTILPPPPSPSPTPPIFTTQTFTVTKSGLTGESATVKFDTANGAGINGAMGGDGLTPGTSCGAAGIDYISQSGTLIFPATGTGSTTQTITVKVCKDSDFEPDETFTIDLSAPTNASISDSQGVGTIKNDDIPTGGYIVNTTDDTNDGNCNSAHCSLREAINAANGGTAAVAINFAIPDDDHLNLGGPRHFYYLDDGGGTANGTLGAVTVTLTAGEPATIDPDWPHSWWSILPTSQLPAISQQVFLQGYTQPGAVANTATNGSTNAVLRIELDGEAAGLNTNGLIVNGGASSLRGLVINRFNRDSGAGTPAGIGVELRGSGHLLAGCFIGTDPSGTLDLDPSNNGGSGVSLTSGGSHTVGGTTANTSTPEVVNLISGNARDGIAVDSISNMIQGNLIGTKANGTSALANSLNGISFSGAGFNTVGIDANPDTNSGEGNTIASNTGDGVVVTAGTGNSIRGNSMFSNGSAPGDLGIDLGSDGLTANDYPIDPDGGANTLQNFPEIKSVVVATPNVISGILKSIPDNDFTIDFYANPGGCDTSGNGEGKTYLGSKSTTTDANGLGAFRFNPASLSTSDTITATATDVSGNTSEFSACFGSRANAPGTLAFVQANTDSPPEGASGTQVVEVSVKRTGGSDRAVSVSYQITDGTAKTSDNDYSATNGTLAWANGETADKKISITVNGDGNFETDETVNIKLVSPTGGATLGLDQATMTIKNDDSAPTMAINDVTLAEGNSGTTNFVFSVALSNRSYQAVGVNYATADGTATAPGDYTATSGLLSIPAGTLAGQITVPVKGETVFELAEQFVVNLSGATNASGISDAQGVGTINNDDSQPTISIGDKSQAEGNSGSANFDFAVTLSSATYQTVTVNYATVDGTAQDDNPATEDNDYVAKAGTLTFLPGETSKAVSISVNGDVVLEADETLTVHLSSPSNATILDADGLGTVQNDEAARTLSIDDVSLTEGNSGTKTFAFTVTLSGATSQTVTVSYATADGTAVAPGDYTAIAATTLTFDPLETSKTVNVSVNGDLVPEANETFFVNLSGATAATISDNQGQGTIVNDDITGFQFEQPSYSVNENGSKVLIVVKRTGDTSVAATVDYATNDFTGVPATDLQPAHCEAASSNASSKCDYATSGGRLRFAAGDTSKTIELSIVDDVFQEGDETLSMSLANPSTGNVVSPSTTVITIQSDDTTPPNTNTNPYLQNAFFVRQHYLDFLLREPDTNGYNSWLSILNNCNPNQGFLGSPPQCDRVEVSSGFFRSTEFGERGYWVYRFFTASLGRRPLYAEFTPEMRRLSGLKPAADLAQDEADFINEFMQRPEFTTIYNGLTDTGHASAFISKLEEKAGVTLPTTVPATQPGQPPQYNRQDLINKRASGEFTAAQTLRAFVEQKTVWDAYFFKAFVAMEYFGYLRRDPEDAGYDDWVDVLTNGRPSAGVGPSDYRHLVFGFIYSEEYRARFGVK